MIAARVITGSLVLASATASLWWIHQGNDKDESIEHLSTDVSIVAIDEGITNDIPEMVVLAMPILSKDVSADSQPVNTDFPGTTKLKQKLTEANNVLNQYQSYFNSDLIELSENVQDKRFQSKLSKSLASATDYRAMILQKAKYQNAIEELNSLGSKK